MSGCFPIAVQGGDHEGTVASLECGGVDACLIMLKISQDISNYGLKCYAVWIDL